MVFLSLLMILSMFLPFEMPFSKTIPSEKMFPLIQDGLNYSFNIFKKFHLTVQDILIFFWVAGSLWYFGRSFFNYYSFKKTVDICPELQNSKIQNILEKVKKERGMQFSFKLFEVDFIPSPALFGFRETSILTPSQEYSEENWYYILTHEIIDYERDHLWIKFFLEILCGIFWWNPIIFHFRKSIHKLLEIQVDYILTEKFNKEEYEKYLDCLSEIKKKGKNKKEILVTIPFTNSKFSTFKHRQRILFNKIQGHHMNFRKLVHSIFPLIIVLFLSMQFTIYPCSIDPHF